jgi:4-diphosphocytidyl-2-C-methyl-D-erythritol kinase
LVESGRAKVNLYLHVVGRRADGYHLLDSLVVFPAIGDRLRAEPDDGLSLRIEGPFGAALTAEPDNLVLRAARALAEAAGIVPRARLILDKHLPVASGIGGGSADAAATLRLLARLWGVAVGEKALRAIALRLGADVPVCLPSVPARMEGIGEMLAPAPDFPGFAMVLINPGVAVATPAVFRAYAAGSAGFSARAGLPGGWNDAASLARDLAGWRNDLEAPARQLCPPIGEVLDALAGTAGCLLARMSGSGATCFGLFAMAEAARAAAEGLDRPGWWVRAG